MSTPPRSLTTTDDARALLVELGAPARLVRHGLLVAEAAEALLAHVRSLHLRVDERLVLAGAILHDAGKSLHPAELSASGSLHEEAGQQLLLDYGVHPAVARCRVSHARWSELTCSLEELLVALADALWKGVRRPALEQRVTADIAERLGADAWSVFVGLDSCFERIAEGGTDRLRRS